VTGRVHIFDQIYGFIAFSVSQNTAYQPVDLFLLHSGGGAIGGIDYDCSEVLIFVIRQPQALFLLEPFEIGTTQVCS
jgi:hypothetical protein